MDLPLPKLSSFSILPFPGLLFQTPFPPLIYGIPIFPSYKSKEKRPRLFGKWGRLFHRNKPFYTEAIESLEGGRHGWSDH